MKNLTTDEKVKVISKQMISQEYLTHNLDSLKRDLSKESFNTLAQYDFCEVIDTLSSLVHNVESNYKEIMLNVGKKKPTKASEKESDRLHNYKMQLKLELVQKIMDI